MNVPANWIAFLFYFYWHFCSDFGFLLLENVCLGNFSLSKIFNSCSMWFLLVSTEFVTLCCTPNEKKKKNGSNLKRKKIKATKYTLHIYSLVVVIFFSRLFSFLSFYVFFSTYIYIFLLWMNGKKIWQWLWWIDEIIK